MSLLRPSLSTAVALLLLVAPFVSSAVTLEPPSMLQVSANEYTLDQSILYPSSLPFVDADSASFGGSGGAVSYDLDSGEFRIEFQHTRSALSAGNAYATSSGSLYFSVDVPTTYSLAGHYYATDVDGLLVSFNVILSDETTFSTLYQSAQQSRSTPNEQFDLGLEEGDFQNSLVGVPTGLLLPGRTYKLHYSALINAPPFLPAATASASADGLVAMTLVPEPATALLLVAAACGLPGARLRGC